MQSMCRSLACEREAIKDVLSAYWEACYAQDASFPGNWSHIVVYITAQKTGWYNLKTKDQVIVFPLFKFNYNDILAKYFKYKKNDSIGDLMDKKITSKRRCKDLVIQTFNNAKKTSDKFYETTKY